MSDRISDAIERAATDGAPPKTWLVGPDADVDFGAAGQGHPFDGLTITHWTRD
ncbi:MAG: hypothetical protein JST91_28195 [Actinobacteria bacterium]|nr:hypothetical protein [Actinomycetota bacterium]